MLLLHKEKSDSNFHVRLVTYQMYIAILLHKCKNRRKVIRLFYDKEFSL